MYEISKILLARYLKLRYVGLVNFLFKSIRVYLMLVYERFSSVYFLPTSFIISENLYRYVVFERYFTIKQFNMCGI